MRFPGTAIHGGEEVRRHYQVIAALARRSYAQEASVFDCVGNHAVMFGVVDKFVKC
jgi:hypothetical protein